MGTITSTIFIGQAHPNHSGINPTHLIQLSENSRPALILRNIERNGKQVIIPTIENMVDDIFLMIGALIIHKVSIPDKILDTSTSLYDITDEERLALYATTMEVMQNHKLKVVFSIMSGSTLLLPHHIDSIKKYPSDIEITTSIYNKEFNAWSGKVEIKE